MRLEAEVTVPLDERRSVWIHLVALDVEPDDIERAASALAEQTTAQALAAYQHASEHAPVAPDAAAVLSRAGVRSGGHPSGLAPSERPPREDDPESMQTFGDDDAD